MKQHFLHRLSALLLLIALLCLTACGGIKPIAPTEEEVRVVMRADQYDICYDELRYYTCNLKVTVKLKKKPGTKGLWITLHDGFGQTKWVKGNKKTYTATFKPYPNYFAKKPKGHYKYKVTVQSGQSKSWGGYSPAWSKNKKLK